MQSNNGSHRCDVAIVGGGPAGLSAAIVLARACRRVILFDHGKPRNYAARAVHCFLGLEGIAPDDLRKRGRKEAISYGVEINDCKVTSAKYLMDGLDKSPHFLLDTESGAVNGRALLLATGVKDYLPQISGIEDLYGRSVHHCPYCDGWEHRGEHLVALADGSSVVKLATSLRIWSKQVTACSNGHNLSRADQQCLARHGIGYRAERLERLTDPEEGWLKITFCGGSTLACGAIFFGADQGQRSHLPHMLGCEIDDNGLVQTDDKQRTSVPGVFVAGDAAEDAQFAVVAAAEGAIAAATINKMLTEHEMR
jgi:thioredoxin reductase